MEYGFHATRPGAPSSECPPVLFLAFNKPRATRQVLDAIRRARPSRLYVATDGPRIEKHEEAVLCRAVREIVSGIDWDCSECRRVLKPGDVFVSTREHVVDSESDLARFLDSHPMHHLFGGENAFPLRRYLSDIEGAGIEITAVLSPWETDINLFPETIDNKRAFLARRYLFPFPRLIPAWFVHRAGRRLTTPGRLYTFAGGRR